MRLKDKVAVITGGASGIGRASALLMAREGARIGIVDLNVQGAQETVALIRAEGDEAMFVQADVTNEREVQSMIKQIIASFSKINVLFNCAGGWRKPPFRDNIIEESSSDWDQLLSLNLKSTFLCSKYAIPEMKKSGGGSIINTASTAGIMNSPNLAAYGTAKAAVIELTKSMCMDYGPANIRVNVIAPGEVVTPQWTATFDLVPNKEEVLKGMISKIPIGRFANADDIANVVLWLASDESGYVSGTLIPIDGGTTAGVFA